MSWGFKKVHTHQLRKLNRTSIKNDTSTRKNHREKPANAAGEESEDELDAFMKSL
jgi:hypothetical protein